jgi:hypothetical protein
MGKKILGSILLLFSLIAAALAIQDRAASNQTDLSGTYTGTFNCDVLGLTGDTTLTITGNEFTTADGKTGRIVASTTGGYTAVALQLGGTTGDTTGATTGATGTTTAPQIVSLRARKAGNRLILTSVPGSTTKCSFTPSRATARGRRNQPTQSPAPTEVASPVPPPTPTDSPIPAQTPSPSPSPIPTATPSPAPSPEPSPEPNPSPAPTPQPVPTPSPVPNPSPVPSPTASPSPTPSPTPSPSPRS